MYRFVIFAFLLLINGGNAVHAAAQTDPSPAFVVLDYLGLPTILYFWFAAYSRRHHIAWTADMGWFLCFAWWAILPYYLFKTLRARAWLTILEFTGAYVGTYLAGVLLYSVMV